MSEDSQMATPEPIVAPAARSAAAERMRRHRERRRRGVRFLTIELRATEIDALIWWGVLKADARNDAHAVREALHVWLERMLLDL
jgi:hypothetical protein